MKELSIEEKAKLYDNAYKKVAVRFGSNVADEIFPEHKKFEDDDIRKWLIGYFNQYIIDGMPQVFGNGLNVKDVIAWLEKQCEKAKPIEDFDTEFEIQISHLIASAINREYEYNQGYVKWAANALLEYAKHDIENQGEQKTVDEIAKEVCKNKTSAMAFLKSAGIINEKGELAEQYRQDEQKPADKVEPKFKVGDWCIDNEDGTIFQITKVLDNTYTYKTNEGKEYSCPRHTLENDTRLWTIQDAKDGDVLAVEHIGRYKFPFIAIYKNYGLNFFNSYCSIGFDGKFYEADTEHVLDDIHPATKEQRELLFQKMKEAGYKWDAEKKELKKVEQKPAVWSDEDEEMLKSIKYHLDCDNADIRCYGWLEELKDRVQPQPKQEWSEEDEKMAESCKNAIVFELTDNAKDDELKTDPRLKWIKSLKDRVQLQDRIDIEVWVTKNKQWILKLNGKVVRGQWGDEPQCIYKQFFYLNELISTDNKKEKY